ncbi:MAG TPA: translation initiation factor IF-2 [Ruminiclostridium sp.]|nr:translation initiation factor IF-2 [Ruminiclostridium sp.]
MSKRIFELAKELNTTSKRLIEKLAEINISVKSHMSLLEEDELERLYKHIGVVNRSRVDGSDEKSATERQEEPDNLIARKNIPRIIRKTEIIIHDDDYGHDSRGKEKKKSKRSYVRTSSSTDGLMAGLRRDSDGYIPSIRKHVPSASKNVQEQEKPAREKAEEPKVKDLGTDDIIGISSRTDRIRRPVDSILSIKKVASREEREKLAAADSEDKRGIAVTGEQADEAERIKPGKEPKTTESPVTDKKKDKTSPKTEKTDKHMKLDVASDQDKLQKLDAERETESTDTVSKEPVTRIEPEKAAKPAEKEEEAKKVQAGAVQAKKDSAAPKPDSGQSDGQRQVKGISPAADKDVKSAKLRKHQQPERSKSQAEKYDYAQSKEQYRGREKEQKTLVIPKANIIPGLVEEKNNLRGERRSSLTRDLEKGAKREAKIEQPRKDFQRGYVFTGTDRNKYKKNFIIGHKARVNDLYSDDYVLNEFYEEKERLKKDKKSKKEARNIPPKAVLKEITIPESITVKNLAEALKKTSAEVIKKLMSMGIMATLNEVLDFDTAAIIGDEFNVKVNKEVVVSEEEILFDETEDKEEDLVPRAPVVVVMGHVDHGKTSLLDAIRKTNVAEHEAGGITQRIGAYRVRINDRDITFLDTPGHEAFTAMRARGAKATDIAILVVAADDGVMPQTIEAINHAKAANVSIIVAINKIDKPGANPDRVKQELAEHGILIEEWGGDVIAVPISAKMGTNIDQLLEMVLLTADILELKANPDRQAKGIVIEAQLDKGRGPVASLLVQRGTLHNGDAIISGTTFGRIRAMIDDKGRRIESAGPSTPVEIIGLDEVPEAGEVFYAVTDEKVAKQLVERRRKEQREQTIGMKRKVSLDDLFDQIKQGEVKELNIIVKADVQGSVEAIKQSLEKLSNEEVKVQIIHGGVGTVNEADVTLADVSNAIIIGFNVRPPANVVEAAAAVGVDIRLYRVIYNAIEDIQNAMKGMLDPTYKEVVDGHAEVRKIFKASSVGTIGGCYVIDGKITRSSDVRVVRDGIVVYEGKLASLKRFTDDVREVVQGYECGILIDRFNDIKEGDVIEAYRMVEVER